MRRWIVTALGKDQPGIVAGVTKVLFQAGCNLEDSAMTRLEGEFTVMLIFSGPPRATLESLKRAFESVARRLKLAVHVKPLSSVEARRPRQRGKSYLISVYGADQPGIVYRVAEAMAVSRINITDVETHRSGGSSSRRNPALYMMLLEVEAPAGTSLATLKAKLQKLGKKLGVQVSVRPTITEVL